MTILIAGFASELAAKIGSDQPAPELHNRFVDDTAVFHVRVDVEQNYAELENCLFRIKYSQKSFKDGATNNLVTEMVLKGFPSENQVAPDGQIDGVWMGYAKGRGVLSKGSMVKYDGSDKKTLHLEWGDGQVIQDITIYPNSLIIRIDYIKYGINIVDIGTPGGDSTGTYNFYGAEKWQVIREKITDDSLVHRYNAHHRLTTDLYPTYPLPLIDTPDWNDLRPEPMFYKDRLIMGLVNKDNGRGFGRVMTGVSANYIKLLWRRGFEIFPYWTGEGKKREVRPSFTGYLFFVTGGINNVEKTGKEIVDGNFD